MMSTLPSFTFSDQPFSLSRGIMCWWLFHLWYHLTFHALHPSWASNPYFYISRHFLGTLLTSPFSALCPLKWPSPTSHLILMLGCQPSFSFDIGNPHWRLSCTFLQVCILQLTSVTSSRQQLLLSFLPISTCNPSSSFPTEWVSRTFSIWSGTFPTKLCCCCHCYLSYGESRASCQGRFYHWALSPVLKFW